MCEHRSSVVFPSFVVSWLLDLQKGISFNFWLISLYLLALFFFFFSVFRMARDLEEASTSQVGRKRGTPQETSTVNSLVVAMSVEDLRSFRQVPAAIRLLMSDGATTLIVGTTDNVVYFT